MPPTTTGRDDRTREHRILIGLALEWELAAGELDACYRQRLQRPLFRLADMPARLGQWDASKREICLNRRLATDHPWDEIRDVLRHEMAHQLAQTVLHNADQPPHGPAFQQACLMLQADPAATAAHQPLHARLAQRKATEESPRHAKIRKLLALAQSRNANEAEAAMLKAHELMARHHISTLMQDPGRTFISIFLGPPALRHFKEAYFLANLIQDFYFVQGIWVPAYVVTKEKMGRVLEVSGTPANVAQAGYVFAFVNAYVERRWQEMMSLRRLTRYQKSDFAVGIIEGFRRQLDRQQLPEAEPAARALIRQSDPRLTTYLQSRYPRTSRIQRGSGHHDPNVYRRGRQLGEEMILHRGIAHNASAPNPLLPPS
jgi:hypothetical protein